MPDKSKPNARCAIYARSATSRCATSVADQVKRCRDFARQHGFAVPDEHVYTDQEASGLSIESRPALARLLTPSERIRPFRRVLVVGVDRLTRHLPHVQDIQRRLERQDVCLCFIESAE